MRRRLNSRSLLAPWTGSACILALTFAAARCSTTFTVPGSPESVDASWLFADSSGQPGDSGASDSGHDAASDATRDSSVDAGGSGHTDATPPVDSGKFDSGSTAPHVTFVNATEDLRRLGLCLAIEATPGSFQVVPAPPIVLPMGGTYELPWQYGATSLSGFPVAVFAIDVGAAPSLGAAQCSASILSDGGLSPVSGPDGGILPSPYASDIWTLAPIPADTVGTSGAFAMVVTGCRPGDSANGTKCGAYYTPGASNLSVVSVELDWASIIPNGSVGVQFLQASSAWETINRGAGGTATAAELVTPSDGGTTNNDLFTTFTAGTAVGTLSPPQSHLVSTLANRSMIAAGILPGQTPTPVDGGYLTLTLSVDQIAALTWGLTDAGQPATPPGTFASGTSWTFVLVGDPTVSLLATDGGVDLAAAHIIAVSNAH